MFTASTIFASFLLFRGFNTSGAPAISLLGGFVVIFVGVYLLNLNRLIDPVTQQPRVSLMTGEGLAGTGRLSEHHERLLNGDGYHSRYSSGNHRDSMNRYPPGRASESRHGRTGSNGSVLFNVYDHEDEEEEEEEEHFSLRNMKESSEDGDERQNRSPKMIKHNKKLVSARHHTPTSSVSIQDPLVDNPTSDVRTSPWR